MMTRYFSAVFIFIAGIFGVFAQSGKSALQNSLLWEITGNGLEKPSYLFGTFHMMCKDRYVFPEKLSTAMEKTQQTVLEINFSDVKQMAAMQQMLLADRKLTEIYSQEEQARFRKGIADYGMKMEDIDQLSPLALYSMLSMKFFPCQQTDMKMIDLEIMQKTMMQGKKIDGLETVSMQSEIFSKYLSPAELLKLVENFEKSRAQTNELLNIYLKEDITALSANMHDADDMSPEQQAVLLDNRNIEWIKKMPDMMKTMPTLFAVGAGHLMGKNGVITLLRKKGYSVKPVLN